MNKAMLMSADKELVKVVKSACSGLPIKFVAECFRTKTAIDSLQAEPVKLMIVDLFLPESSGLEALKTIKKIDESILVILLSRVRARGVLDKAFRYGCADVIIYPASEDFIRQAISHRLKKIEKDRTIVFHQSQE